MGCNKPTAQSAEEAGEVLRKRRVGTSGRCGSRPPKLEFFGALVGVDADWESRRGGEANPTRGGMEALSQGSDEVPAWVRAHSEEEAKAIEVGQSISPDWLGRQAGKASRTRPATVKGRGGALRSPYEQLPSLVSWNRAHAACCDARRPYDPKRHANLTRVARHRTACGTGARP